MQEWKSFPQTQRDVMPHSYTIIMSFLLNFKDSSFGVKIYDISTRNKHISLNTRIHTYIHTYMCVHYFLFIYVIYSIYCRFSTFNNSTNSTSHVKSKPNQTKPKSNRMKLILETHIRILQVHEAWILVCTQKYFYRYWKEAKE